MRCDGSPPKPLHTIVPVSQQKSIYCENFGRLQWQCCDSSAFSITQQAHRAGNHEPWSPIGGVGWGRVDDQEDRGGRWLASQMRIPVNCKPYYLFQFNPYLDWNTQPDSNAADDLAPIDPSVVLIRRVLASADWPLTR